MNEIIKLADEIRVVGAAGIAEVAGAATSEELEAIRIKLLGKKGIISDYLKRMSGLTIAERKIVGPLANGLKRDLGEAITAKRRDFDLAKLEQRLISGRIDVSLPVEAAPFNVGRIHPLTKALGEIYQIFSFLGFKVAEGGDIENDYYNFTALNFPADHPAREMHDTFFFACGDDGARLLLRTHTSPVQIRVMEKQPPPIRIITPGRVYRCDSDHTHTPMFHQLEILVIEQGVHAGHMKWLINHFLEHYFGISDFKLRLRPSFFPFTEPSFEVDINYDLVDAQLVMGGGDNWMEIMGCGMVHPNVLRNCGLDPDQHQGFACGLGIDRIAMLKYGIPDLRDFFHSDIRWLNHYGFAPFEFSAPGTS